MKTIKLKIENTKYPLLFALTFDEMSIRKHVEYDGQTCHGYVSFGVSEDDEDLPLAKETFAMVVVAINANWIFCN